MVFHHIKKIRNHHVRRATYGILSLHGLFLSLVAIKTAIFHIAGLKLLFLESAFLVSMFGMIPHVTFAQSLAPIDYSISNSTYPVMTDQGQMVTYMYYYQNESSPYTPGSSVTVSANIPQGMAYHSHEGPNYTSLTANQITWNIPANQSRFGMLLLRLMVSPSATGPLNNTVTIDHMNTDPVPTNNTATAIIIANNSALSTSNVDLQITKTVNRTTATLMDDIVFTINYSNQGTQTASGVKVYEVLPPELYIVSRSVEPTTIQSNLYTWDIGNLAPGQGGQIVLRTSILPIVENGENIINYAVISSQMVESNIANNSSEVSILVQDEQPNLDIAITAPKTIICVNETLTFTVNITNQGIGNANNVTVQHNKPSTLGWIGSNRTVTNPTPGVYNWAYDTSFFPGASASLTMDLKGLGVGEDQAVPIKVLSNGQEYDQAIYYVTVVPESLCNVIQDPDPIPGCTNPAAVNHNPNATQNDGSCIDADDPVTVIPGCTNATATNYNANATVDNGSCAFAVPGCTIPTATNFNSNATVNNGTCIMPNTTNTGTTNNTGTANTGALVIGCMNPTAINYNSGATVSSGVCNFNPNPTTQSGAAGTGEEKSFFILPKAPVTPTQTNTGTPTQAKPSNKFFISTPAPQKPATQQKVQTLQQAVSANNSSTSSPKKPSIEDIPTSCEANMVDIYTYAKANELVNEGDIPDLCKTITRAKLAELMVNYALQLALIEPNLKRSCIFNDTAGYNNEDKFYMALACDFGFLGVNNDGSVQKSFRPGAVVTRGEFALTASRFLFGDTLKDPLKGTPRYSTAMQALYDAYVMKDISNPDAPVLFGHVLSMMRRIDKAELIENTKYIRLREKK